MTKKEIVKAISEELGKTQLETKEIVQKTFDAIIDTLVGSGRIELRNFGVFEVKKRAARKARNPKTDETVMVAEKYVVTFKPGKEMQERVRGYGDRVSPCVGTGIEPTVAAPVSDTATFPPPVSPPIESSPAALSQPTPAFETPAMEPPGDFEPPPTPLPDSGSPIEPA